jgi:prepilin peptidase CpaA
METLIFWLTLAVLTVAVVTDLRTRRIPNLLVGPFLAAGLIARTCADGLEGMAQSVTGISVAAGVLGILCYLRGMGLGDLKLCAALGAWIGPSQMITALVVTAMAGGFLAAGHSIWRRTLGARLDGAGELLAALAQGGLRPHLTMTLENPAAERMPYAVAIAIGTMFSFYTL